MPIIKIEKGKWLVRYSLSTKKLIMVGYIEIDRTAKIEIAK